MMTSNRPLKDWAKRIGDALAAIAILDRFLQHATIINITGKSYRLRHGGNPEAKANSKGRLAAGQREGTPPEDTKTAPPVSSGVGVVAEAKSSSEG
jgi:hypothetical protein